jgi:oligopeptide transport system substrate-binding protein
VGRRALRVALPGQPATLDPNRATDAISSLALAQLHEGLTRHDSDLLPQPALAQRWSFSPDYTSVTFTLREGIAWSDGAPIVAQHFVDSWLRLLDPKTAAEYAYFLFDIEGAEAFNSGAGPAEAVGVRAPDARTLEVRLRRPAPYFPHIPSFMVTYPVRLDLIAKHGPRFTAPEHLVCSGPFVMRDHEPDYRMVLTPNPRYTLGEVAMERLELYQISEKSTALNLFVSGHLDVVLDMLPLAIPHMSGDPSYYNGPKLEVRYVGFHTQAPGLRDPRAREALSKAIRREELPAVLRGGELPTGCWLPPGMFGHAPASGVGYDPGAARAALAAAGFAGGEGFPQTTLLFRAGDDWRLFAENLQQQWRRELGLEVAIQVRDQKVFFQEIDGDAPPPMHLARWVADFPDPENFMSLFTSSSGNNALGFAEPEYDRLVDAAVRTDDRRERLELYTRAQTILVAEQAAIAPVYVAAQNVLRRPDLEGLGFNAMGDVFFGPTRWRSPS